MYKTFYNQLMKGHIDYDISNNLAEYLLFDANDVEISSLLTLLTTLPLTEEVLHGFSTAMKKHAVQVPFKSKKVIDVCGTGGDGHNTFNVSTTVALILKNFITVAKHGNGSISSKSGSADLLEKMGQSFHHEGLAISEELEKNNFSFLFAPYMHPKMKSIMGVRKQLKIPTIFNVLGPLCNPVTLSHQVIGVYDPDLIMPMANVLLRQNVKRGAVVCGHNKMDELSTTGINDIAIINDGQITYAKLDPKDYDLSYASLTDLQGGTPEDNVKITQSILNGAMGPKYDLVALNAGFALYIGEVASSIEQGIKVVHQYLQGERSRYEHLADNSGA
ncbi:anthranilate phosphoribosyltransferase [Acidaminobacter sp. JC074]|uniref:anthranilate phosphoribosyltransferase n=1 Tax=Acidaminobacter sp. JC074 TaxID=2530199 RepID=UPI001F0D7E30|nr:anthranilate phosphoribosyltransferase [Acidaminobacter sp. JC074]MCH4889979.1 anthranilate phosphoribosyltransferase [Acidaminobacter sp. JC074]